jgi:hypothetical protein
MFDIFKYTKNPLNYKTLAALNSTDLKVLDIETYFNTF